MTLELRLLKIASTLLRRSEPDTNLFKKIVAASLLVSETNTDKLIEDAVLDEREDEPPIEIIDADDNGETVMSDAEDAEDEDVEGFTGFPMGALPQKERRQGPRPQDVKPGRPDWWATR